MNIYMYLAARMIVLRPMVISYISLLDNSKLLGCLMHFNDNSNCKPRPSGLPLTLTLVMQRMLLLITKQ